VHSLSVIVGPAIWTLMFKTEEKAQAAYETLRPQPSMAGAFVPPELEITDDFGQTIAARRDSIHGRLLEDLDVSKEAVIERMIHNAKVQAEAQAKASRDSSLRHAAHGPAVLSPGMMPRFS